MIRNVLKPDGTVHIEQQVANMRYDLTTGQVETVVPGAGATNLVFGADGRQHVELTTGNIRRNLGRPGFATHGFLERLGVQHPHHLAVGGGLGIDVLAGGDPDRDDVA